MFVELAELRAPEAAGANIILSQYRPLQILELLEACWQTGVPALPPGEARTMPLDLPAIVPPGAPFALHHIVYAYMLENTRLVDIMRRVVWEYRHGERLPAPNPETEHWLNTTEQLFYALPLHNSVRAVTSLLRADPDAVRRNAYYRLLGMDLNHGTEDGRPYPYVKPEAANRDFAMVFEALLAEVWKAYANRLNVANENTTDDNAIIELVRRIREMLRTRRNNAPAGVPAALAREEFDAVAIASWFYVTVAYDTYVVQSLAATGAASIADRLGRIGARVGLPPHARSDAYFQLAMPMSIMLRAFEVPNFIVTPPQAQLLYAGGVLTDQMLQIITHWSIATGRNLKDPTMRQPLGVLAATARGVPAAVGGNGAPVNRIAGVLR